MISIYLVAMLPNAEILDDSVFFKDRSNIFSFYNTDGGYTDFYFSQINLVINTNLMIIKYTMLPF
jgi:hypothetical protein